MPEGDTVYLLARRLERVLDGQLIVGSDLRVPSLATSDLAGHRILEHVTHGKHLLTRMSDDLTLHTHLRMDGSWTVLRQGKQLPRRAMPDVRVVLQVESGHTAYGVLLPVVGLVRTSQEATVVGHLGPDPLRKDWDEEEAVRRLSADPDRPLVAALLDQRLVAGWGNVWANELCFLRGHSPWTPIGEVDVPAVVRLGARALRQSAFVPGSYQITTGNKRRGEQHWVYGRGRRPCLRCGTEVRIIESVPNDPGQRRTYWCPTCQPGPEREPQPEREAQAS